MRSERTRSSLRDIWLLIVSITLILFAVVGFYLLYNSAIMGNGKSKYSSVGERIYYSGRGSDGKHIEYTGGPRWLSSLKLRGCVNCHGEDGKGGYPLVGGYPMIMSSSVAPDITYSSLVSADHADHDDAGQTHEHEDQYTAETIKQAITQGTKPSGERMSIIMPRWKMTAEDLDEILEYLKNI